MNIPLKSTMCVVSMIIVLSCNSTGHEKKNDQEKQSVNFDWLIGKWKRSNEEIGKETFENWEKASQNEYIGIGFTTEGVDTVKQEKIKIRKQNGKWILTVKVPEESASINFPITAFKPDEFSCTNDSLEFPKKIKYWKNGKRIYASVAGDSLKIDFAFERIK